MKPAPFAYQRPTSLSDAVAVLAADDGSTRLAIAGGQSLMPMLALRVAPADLIVDIGRLPELKAVEPIDGGLRIGAGVTHADIEDGKVADPTGGLMRKVAGGIAYRAVRNHGTIGGSVALADPAADWPACLLALGATVRISGPNGERTEAMDDFLQGAYSTSLQPGEIITAFDVPTLGASARFGHAKVVRKSGAFAMSIGCVVRRTANDVTAVLGGTTTRASRLPTLVKVLCSPAAPSESDIRTAFAADLAVIEPDADAYQQRLHTATIVRSVNEAMA